MSFRWFVLGLLFIILYSQRSFVILFHSNIGFLSTKVYCPVGIYNTSTKVSSQSTSLISKQRSSDCVSLEQYVLRIICGVWCSNVSHSFADNQRLWRQLVCTVETAHIQRMTEMCSVSIRVDRICHTVAALTELMYATRVDAVEFAVPSV